MAKKSGIDPAEIKRVKDDIDKYQQEVFAKFDEFRRRLAEEIASDSQLGFDGSTVDDVVKGGSPRQAEVTVRVDNSSGSISIVIADGEDAVWCEFGAGVYHNGSTGSSPNKYGGEIGFTIGSYGKGYGKRKAWGYYDNGNLVITRGTPATMPMYKAIQSVAGKAMRIAQEVFG